MNQGELETGSFTLTHSTGRAPVDTTGDLFGTQSQLEIKTLQEYAPQLFHALKDVLALLTNPDAEPEDADQVTQQLNHLLNQIEGA
jgi:hypothetical protein